MLLIAKKKGWFVIVVWVLSSLGCYLANEYFIKKYIEIDPVFILGSACIISGIITYIIRADRHETDKTKRNVIDADNTFFFLNMRYWSYMELLFGLALGLYGFLKAVKVL